MATPSNETKIAIALAFLGILTAAVFAWFGFQQSNQAWLAVGAGFLGIEAVLCLAWEYFWPAKPHSMMRAPDRTARLFAGLLGIASGVFWIISSWPGFLS